MKKIFFLFCVLICTMVCYNVSFSQNDLDKQLFEAVKSNNFDDVKILVEKGANVDALDKDSGTVLMWATYKGDLDLVKFFVEIGADCKKKGVIRTANGWYGNLLSIAAGELKFDLLKYYIEECKINIDDREYNPDTKKEDGWTALHYAVYRGFVNLVVYLLEKGANINVKDYEGNTPLITSVNASESEILKILYLYGADSKIKNNDGKTASDLAKEKNKTSIISFLKNPSVNIFYIIKQHLDNILIKRILENKTLILEKDEFGRSLLHYSILYGNIDLTSQLLDNGADINAKDNDNNTPFHYALNNLKIDIAKNLINRNADLNIKNNNNETALILSIKKGLNDITTLLDEKEYLIKDNLDYKNEKGETLLHLAIRAGNWSLVDKVLNLGANINEKDNLGMTPLFKSIFLGNIEISKELINRDADINLRDNIGISPYLEAKYRGYESIVNLLLAKGADISLDIQQKPELLIQMGHTGAVNSICFSSIGNFIASGSSDGTIKIWEVQTGREINTLKGHSSIINSVTFSPDGKFVVSGSSDNTIILWDVQTGREIKSFIVHSEGVKSVSFSPDGRLIASGSNDKTIRILEVQSGKEIISFKGLHSIVNSINFSPDGRTLVCGCSDGYIKLWDILTGKLLNSMKMHGESIESVIFSPDGKFIASGSIDNTIKLWDVNTDTEVIVLKGHNESVESVCFSSNGKYLISGSMDGTIKLWDIETSKEINTLKGHILPVTSVCTSPDGLYIGSGSVDGTIKIWEFKTGNEMNTLKGHSNYVKSVIVSPDCKYIASKSSDNTIKLWWLQSGREISTFISHCNVSNSISFSQDGRLIASGGDDGTVIIWELHSQKKLKVLKGHNASVYSVNFSSDNKYIASTSIDGIIKLWDYKTGDELYTYVSENCINYSVCLSPDNKYIASGNVDGIINLWELQTGRKVRIIKTNTNFIGSLCFSPNGKYIAGGSGQNLIKLWNITTGKEAYTFKGHSSYISSLNFSSDGKYLVSGSNDYSIKIWDMQTGQEKMTLKGHNGIVNSVSFFQNDKYLISGSSDNKIKIWNIKEESESASLITLDTNDWSIVTPEGLFDATLNGMKLMHFIINTGTGLESIELEQLKERYYEPNLLAKLLGFTKEQIKDVRTLNSLKLFPELRTNLDTVSGKLKIILKNRGSGYGKVLVTLNKREVSSDAKGNIYYTNFDSILTLPELELRKFNNLKPGEENEIEIKTFDQDNFLSSKGIKIKYNAPGEIDTVKPHIWAVIVGISDYDGQDLNLKYAAKDAENMTTALKYSFYNLFTPERTHMFTLSTLRSESEYKPTKQNIINTFNTISQNANKKDILLIYFSGHGISKDVGKEAEEFYFLTKEAISTNLNDPEIVKLKTISSHELTDLILKIPVNKQVMMLDICGAGGFGGLVSKEIAMNEVKPKDVPSSAQTRAIDRMKDRAGMFILAASTDDKSSYEASRYSQGLLTYSLLDGMRGGCLKDNIYIDVMTMFNCSRDKVKQLAKEIGREQTPMIIPPSDASSFDIGIITPETIEKIPISLVKPIVIKCDIKENKKYKDNWGITVKLNAFLQTESDKENSLFEFKNIESLPDAFQIAGGYEVNSDVLTINIIIYKGDRELENFLLKGNSTEADIIIKKVYEKLIKYLNK